MTRFLLALSICSVLAAPAEAAESASRMIPIPRVTLYPGDPLTTENLVLKNFIFPPGAELRFASDPAQLAGRVARRTLAAGKPIALAHVRAGQAVKQGRLTAAVYVEGGVMISGELMPLEGGEAGQRIAARNPATGLTVMAVVQADGTLTVESK